MHVRNYTRDPVLEAIIKDTAKHFGLKVGVVWSLYNFYYIFIRNAMAARKYKYMTVEKLKQVATNLRVTGLGTFKHKFGKRTVFTNEQKDERRKRKSEKRRSPNGKADV